MALRNLSTPELVAVLSGLLDPTKLQVMQAQGRLPDALVERCRAQLGRLVLHHGPPKEASEAQALVATLTAKLSAADVHHDRKVRGIVTLLTALAELSDEEAARTSLLALRDGLFPQGTTLVQRTYEEEIGVAEQLAATLSPAQRAALEAIPALPAYANLAVALDAYLSAARSLRSLENDRSEAQRALTPAEVSPATRLRDRNATVRLLHAIVGWVTLDNEVDPEVERVFLAPLRALEATADARSAAPAPPPAAPPPAAPAA